MKISKFCLTRCRPEQKPKFTNSKFYCYVEAGMMPILKIKKRKIKYHKEITV